MGEAARPWLPDLLKAAADTAEPLKPVVWADPIQEAQGQLAGLLFNGLLRGPIEGVDRTLLYPAIRAVSRNADGWATAQLQNIVENQLTLEDVQALGPEILAAARERAPADTMFGNELRMASVNVLAKYRFKEGAPALMRLAKVIDGHGSQVRIPLLMGQLRSYGTAARELLPELRALLAEYKQTPDSVFPKWANDMRIASVDKAIASIEAAKDQPELRSLSK